MKNSTLILIASMFTHLAFGQVFAPLNAEWHFQKWSINEEYIVDYYSAKAEHDTVINGNYATVLTYRFNGTIIPDAKIIVMEADGKVYFYEDNSFKLLYDFTLSVGDTLTFSVPQNFHYYDISCGPYPDTSLLSLAQVTVDSIIPTIFDNQVLDVFYTTPIYHTSGQYFSWQLGNIIENIGSFNGLFGFSTTQCLGGDFGHFRCYSDSVLTYYLSVEDCDYTTTAINNIADIFPFSVYPNPATNSLTIETTLRQNTFLLTEIKNTFGQVVYTFNDNAISGFYKRTIDLNLGQGIYFLTLQTNQGQMTKRIEVAK